MTGRHYIFRLATQETRCQIVNIDEVVDATRLDIIHGQREVAKNEVAKVTLLLGKSVAFDVFGEFEETGRFVLVDDLDVAGGGIILSSVKTGYSI